MQKLIGTFINGAISAYMVEVKKKDISGSITQKNLDISQLEIFPDALLQHGIPLLVKKGTIKNVSIQIPTKFKSDPLIITIESVTILCNLSDPNLTPEELIKMKLHMLKSYKIFRKCYKLILGLISNHNILSIFRTIISNVILEINNIHVHIECSPKTKETIPNSSVPKNDIVSENANFDENSMSDSSYDDIIDDDFFTESMSRFSTFQASKHFTLSEKVTSVGIVIPKLYLHNPDDLEKVSNKKIIKEAIFTDFGLYVDIDQEPIDLNPKEKCESELLNLYSSKNHNWIMKPFTFNGLIRFNKDDPRIFFEPIIEKVILNIKENYISVIFDILKSFDSFKKKFSVAHIPRPSLNDPNLFWIYCHKCAVSKISNATFDFSKNLSLLLKRVVFLKNYKKKNSKSQEIIKEMQKELDYSTIIAFRAAYRLIHKKRKEKGKSKITAKTTKKIIKEIRNDPIHIVTKIVTNFALNFTGGLLTINLKRKSGHKHISFDIKNLKFMIEKDLKSYIIHASASYECVKYIKEKEIVVFKSIDNDQVEMKFEMIIPFLSYSNWSISLQISRNNYTFNLNGLLQLVSDLILSKMFSSDIDTKNIIAFIKSRHIELNIQVLSSVIKVIGSKNNRAIQYAFDNLSFTTDPKTLERTLKFNNSWISLITDTEAKISSDFSLNGTLNGSKILFNIPLFSCSIPFKYIVVIQDFVNIFMSYQLLFRVDIIPKIKIDFVLELKGMNINIKPPNSSQSKNLQIRDIILKFKDSVIKFRLKNISMSNLFTLKNLKAIYNQKNLDFKITEISTRVMDLLALVPKDALQIIQNQDMSMISSDNDNQIETDANSDTEYNSVNSTSNQERSFELPKINIGLIIDRFIIELSITNKDLLNLYITNINASINNNKLITCAILDRITFEDLIISKQISYQSQVIFDQITEITLQTNNCNLNINKNLILLLLKVEFPSQEIALPHDVGINLSFNIDQMSISNDLIMQNFSSKLSFINSKINVSIGMDSIFSSIVKFKSNDVLQMKVDIKEKLVEMDFNLDEIKIYIIPLVDVISFLSMSKPPNIQNKLIIKIKPIKFNFCFGEDNVNVIFDSPFKLKLDTYQRIIPYIYLKIYNLSINLNNNEIIGIQSIKFILDKNVVIKIPSLYITVSMVKIYKLLKMIAVFTRSSFAKKPKKININKIPIESITTKVPFIQIVIHQTKSRRCVSLSFDNTEFFLTNAKQKSKLIAQTYIHFIASNGFTSKELAPSFKINAVGEISDKCKKCSIKSENPIKFEVSTYILNQILKNLTATEDEIIQPYSIMNETGVEITIFINKNQYILKPNEHLPHITNFAESDIKVKIDDMINPIQICSSFSKISFPLFFGKHFILVWLDPIKLQLQLLSPISFKNKSNVDLTIHFHNQSILLHKNEIYFVNYKIENLQSIIVQSDKQQQKVNLNEKSVIKFSNKYIKISRYRILETLHTIVSFEAPYYFRNELISFLTLSIKNNDTIEYVTLEPCKIIPVPFFTPSTKIISFDILDANEIKGIHVDLDQEILKNNKQFILTKDKEGNQFTIQFTYNDDEMNSISISPLIIYYSSLSIPLIFSLSPDETINDVNDENINESITSFFKIQKPQDDYVLEKPVMISPLIKDYSNINIYIASKYSKQWSSNPFSLTDFDKGNDLKIQIDDEKVSLIHCHIINDSSLNAFIFYISPKYLIRNQTNETFLLNLFEGDSIKIQPNTYIPVTFIRKSLEFSIAIEPKLNKKNIIYSNNINIEKINSQYIKVHPLDSPLLLRSSIEKETHYITFLLNRTLPYLFINNTNYKIIFIQKNTADSSHTVMPNKSLPFYIFDENMPTIIYCEIKDQISFEIDVNQLSFPEKVISSNNDSNMNLYYYVDLSSNEGSTITLSNVINNEINIPKYLNSTSSEYFSSYQGLVSHFDESSVSFNVSDISKLKDDVFNLSLNFDYFSFLIITTQNKELCRITLKDIKIDSSLNDFVTKTKITFGTIKIDDQNKYAIYPSILQILPNENQPAVQLDVNSFGSNKYGKIELDIRPIIIRIDLSFLTDFIGEIFYFESNDNQNKLVFDNYYDNMKYETNDISLSEIINNLMPRQIKYHINSILIHPFIINLSFHTITMRSNHPLQRKYQINRFVNFIPSFDELTISINNLHYFQNLSGTSYEIVYKITNDIKKMILFQMSIKHPILKTKEKIESFLQPQIIYRLKSGISNKMSSFISIIETSLCYISSLLDIYTDSPPKIRTNEISIYWGISSFVSSFKEGINQLIIEPKKRGIVNGKNYYCGYIYGSGIGILKCAVNLTSGFLCLTASLFSTTKRIFANKKSIFMEKRENEPSLGMNCSDNEQLLWYTKMASSGLIEVYTNSVFISKNKTLIKDVSSIEIEKTSVIIYDINHKKYVNDFNDENQAIFFFNVIQSQLLRKKIFEIHNDNI